MEHEEFACPGWGAERGQEGEEILLDRSREEWGMRQGAR